MKINDSRATSTTGVSYNDDIDTIMETLPTPLRNFLQDAPKDADIHILLDVLRQIWQSSENWGMIELQSAIKNCILFSGQLVLNKKYYEARAVCLVFSFLRDLVESPGRHLLVDTTFGFNESELRSPELLSGFRLFQLACETLETSNYRFVQALVNVVNLWHPSRNQWLEPLIASEGFSEQFWKSPFSWINVTIEDCERGSLYKTETSDFFGLNNLLNMYFYDSNAPDEEYLHVRVNGRTLVKSIYGNKSLFGLGIKDGSVIEIGGERKSRNAANANTSTSSKQKKKQQSKQNNKSKAKQGKKKQSNKNKKQQTHKRGGSAKEELTLEECKEEHSKALGRVFDEVRTEFALIRKRINDQAIQKTKPKKRVSKFGSNATENALNQRNFVVEDGCKAGKAGKVVYRVLVGEEANLYKTGKGKSYRMQAPKAITLDLHGCTCSQSLEKLNESLPKWVDKAMKGNYPYTIPVNIVCGGGNQVLSDAVKGWISDEKNVAHRPNGV